MNVCTNHMPFVGSCVPLQRILAREGLTQTHFIPPDGDDHPFASDVAQGSVDMVELSYLR